MTNAQAALIAASSLPGSNEAVARSTAGQFKAWLDQQDQADRQRALYGAAGQ